MESNSPPESSTTLAFLEEQFQQTPLIDLTASISILSQLKSLTPPADLLILISNQIKDKRIVYIRHAESYYNSWKTKSIFNVGINYKNIPENHDPLLTEKGHEQCAQLREKLDKERKYDIELVFVSPLQRAMQTCLDIFPSPVFENCKEVIASQFLREHMDSPGDVGTTLSQLRQIPTYTKINFDFVKNEKWWSYKKEESDNVETNRRIEKIVKEKKEHIEARLALMILWLVFRNEKNIALVAHSGLYKRLMKLGIFSRKIKNASLIELENAKLVGLLSSVLNKAKVS